MVHLNQRLWRHQKRYPEVPDKLSSQKGNRFYLIHSSLNLAMKIIFSQTLLVAYLPIHSSTQDTLEHTFKMLSGDSDLVTVASCRRLRSPFLLPPFGVCFVSLTGLIGPLFQTHVVRPVGLTILRFSYFLYFLYFFTPVLSLAEAQQRVIEVVPIVGDVK